MQNIRDVASPMTWLGVFICITTQILLFFQPTFYEYLLFLLADWVLLFVVKVTDPFLFPVFFPKARAFFPHLDEELAAKGSLRERRALFEAIAAYPAQRAYYLYVVNFFKIIPAGLVIVFLWKHPYSSVIAAWHVALMMLVNMSFLSGMVYLDNHTFLTKQVQELHRRYDWSQVFASGDAAFRTPSLLKDVRIHAVLGIIFFSGSLQLAILSDRDLSLSMHLAESLLLSMFSGLYIIRIISVTHNEILAGVGSIIAFFSTDETERPRALALSTSPMIAYFQRALNDLILQVNLKEREIATWIMERFEKKRYADLGQMTGLVVHDLLNPMHSMRYCIKALREQQESISLEKRRDYLEQLEKSSKHVFNLLDNLRNNIRKQDDHPASAELASTYQSVLGLLPFQFERGDLARIRFECELPPQLPRLAIPQPELMQVINNLYSNSVKNLLEYHIPEPTIKISYIETQGALQRFLIRDNGTGLSWKDFEFISAGTGEDAQQTLIAGIGLRLTRRLVEYYKGTLEVESKVQEGTAFVLSLRASTS